MSEPKLISPLLDGFIMGEPMNQRTGACICPAIKENSDSKYIVKIISVPASQRRLDALLLTGAYPDAASALEYFKESADGIVQEAATLRKLSKLEGFLAYEDWQVEPMDGNDLGYHVYLLSPYRLSLEKYVSRNLMTHLSAVNLGLDLCAAAAICRNSGYLYVDLRPGNIYISDDKEYRIGDLGFVKLDSLKYTSIPAQYVSRYTAPEVLDPMSTLNDTVDICAIGLVLYQIYNNGELPYGGNAVAEVFPAPVNADYEMAEIIAKACAPDPKDRWASPMEMGQALVDYMQRNTVNDTPIAPPSAFLASNAPQEESEGDVSGEDATDDAGQMPQLDPHQPSDTTADDSIFDDDSAETAIQEEALPVVPVATQETIRVPVGAFPKGSFSADEPLEADPDSYPEADAPEAPDAEEDNSEADDVFASFFSDDESESYDGGEYNLDDDEEDYEDEDDEVYAAPHRKSKNLLVFLFAGMIVALLCVGGFLFYNNYYVQTISLMTAQPHQNQVTVQIRSNIADSLLTISCTDTYGNRMTLPVEDGQVIFSNLQPNTPYWIEAEISGFHTLKGCTSIPFTSQEQTEITEYTAVTGPQEGSVILEFKATGHDARDWQVTYSTDGEPEKNQTFTGHMVVINNLTMGKTYTFTLSSVTDLYLIGENTLEFTVSSIVLAEDLKITATSGDSLRAQWAAPEGATVASWTVRCYSDAGYDQTQVVTGLSADFVDLTPGDTYTVEVKAVGMKQPVWTSMTSNPVTIDKFTVDDSEKGKLTLNWEFTGEAPEGGWLVMYTLDNGEAQTVIPTKTNSAEISPRIPGSTYHITLGTADSNSVFNGEHSFQCPDAEVFADHSANVSAWKFALCRTPDRENWTPGHVKADDYVASFKPEEKISLVITTTSHYIPDVDKQILYVIRDAEGNALPDLWATEAKSWYLMWNVTYPRTNLTLPKAPTEPGEYKLCLYFDNMSVAELTFTITQDE